MAVVVDSVVMTSTSPEAQDAVNGSAVDTKVPSAPVYGFLGFSEWALVTLLTRRGGKNKKKLGGMEPQQVQDLLASSVQVTLLIAGIELVFFHVFLRLFTRPVWMKILVTLAVLLQQRLQYRPDHAAQPWGVPSCGLHYVSLVLVLPLTISLVLTMLDVPDWNTVSWPMVFDVGLAIPAFEEVVYRLLILKGVLVQRLGSLSVISPAISICLAVGVESGLFASAHAGAGQEAWLVSFVAAVGLSLRFLSTDSLVEVALLHVLHNLHYCFDTQLEVGLSWWSHVAPFLLYAGLAVYSLIEIITAASTRCRADEHDS